MGVQRIENGISSLEISEIQKPNKIGVRHLQTFLMFGGLLFGYFLRVNMSVAIVAMLTPTNNPDIPYYNWENSIKQLLLSSFFWGYVIAQLPSGLLSQKYGAKNILAIATIFCSLFNIIIPISAKFGGWKFVCALRVLIGLCQGVVYPCVHTLLAKWIPKTERGFLSTIVYSGAQLGTVIMLATSGIMSKSSLGWPSIFYFSGALSLLWSIFYIIFGSETPRETKMITIEEKQYIEKYTGTSNNNKNLSVPWKSIFTSIPFMALLFAHCGFTWGFYTLLTQIPTYMSQVLHMDIQTNALLSALPYLAMWLLGLIISPLSDYLINKGIISVEISRKLFNSIGQWIPMLALIGLGYMTKDQLTIAVTLLTIGVGFNSASFVGYLVNHMDLSPNFAGTLMGITNGISNLLSIFAPILVSAVVKNEHDPTQWRIIFFITAGTYLICNLIFVIFGKASIQPWNKQKSISLSNYKNINKTDNPYNVYS